MTMKRNTNKHCPISESHFHDLPDYKDLEENYKRWDRVRKLLWKIIDIAAVGIIAGIIKYVVEK